MVWENRRRFERESSASFASMANTTSWLGSEFWTNTERSSKHCCRGSGSDESDESAAIDAACLRMEVNGPAEEMGVSGGL